MGFFILATISFNHPNGQADKKNFGLFIEKQIYAMWKVV